MLFKIMIIFQIIMIILSFIGMYYFSRELDKEELNTYTALCVGGIAVCGIILGIFSTLILIQLCA